MLSLRKPWHSRRRTAAGRTRPREALAEAPARIHSFGCFLC